MSMRAAAAVVAAGAASSFSAAAAAAGAAATAPPAWPTAVPFWPQYPTRAVQVLTGTWQYGFSAAGDPSTLPYASITTPGTAPVPSAFDVAPPGELGPRGNAFFRSTHACTPGTVSLLKFAAVNFYARVFSDGVDVGNHTAGGYTPFELTSTPCGAGGARELLVVVNNNQSYALSPTFTGGDFYFYGGIIRPVIVTELPAGTAYWLSRVEPLPRDALRRLMDVRVVLGGNLTAAGGSVHLAFGLNGGPLSAPAEYAVVNGTAIIPDVAIPANASLWFPGRNNSGALFTLTVSEAVTQDAITTRTGLRVVGVDDATGRITINGAIVNLHGFNRHTMWPDTGAAVTPAQEAADVALILGLNANYIRGAHYPQSQSFLDLADEAGIVIWEETLGPGTSTANMNDPWFMSNHLTAVAAALTTSMHHPSVVFSAFFNEGPSDDHSACVGYARSSETIKALVGTPPARLVTWANNHLSSDVCLEYADVISFNSYPGWYDHAGNVSYVPTFWAQQFAWANVTWPGKPVTVSETGGGGIFEWVNASAPYPGVFWSQTYQANLVTADAKFITSQPGVSGLTLWQFNDIKANDQSTAQCGQCDYAPTGGYPTRNLSIPWTCAYISSACGRPGGENHKGSVDFWRRPKAEYAQLAAIFGAIPSVVEA
jgi:beta-glucuronidase